MSTLPTGFAQLTLAFAPLFSKRVSQSVRVLLFGAILAIGKRTWHGEQNRMLQVASETAVRYHSGMPVIALRWVLVRDPL